MSLFAKAGFCRGHQLAVKTDMQTWLLILILLLPPGLLTAGPATATPLQDSKSEQEKISQKIRMISMILNSPDLRQRAENSEDPLVEELIARASENFVSGKDYFNRGLYLEAEAVLGYVLRDLSAGSQLLSRPQQKSREYRQFLGQLDSFVLPDWSELSEQENDELQAEMTRVSELRDQAARLAATDSWEAAQARLEEAYQIKVSLLERFRHTNTIVYDLDFATVQDEYQYLSDRTYHYLDLVQSVLSQIEINPQTRKLTDKYLYDSMLNLESAENFESKGNFSEAIPVLHSAIKRLSSVLKILGITI